MNRRDWLVALVLALAAFLVYLLTLAPDLLPGDSGEFQLAVPLLGIVHPTGYPLYLLLGKLFTFLPLGTIAARVNLFSAASAAAAAGAFYLAARVVSDRISTARPLAMSIVAAAIVLSLAFSPTWWSQATEAEVYALNALFVIVLVGLSIRLRESSSFRDGQNARLWLCLALALGLSLAHHRTTILLAPVLAVYLFPYCGLRAVLPRALLLAALPLLLYLYTPLRYDASPYLQTKLDAQHVIVSLDDTPQAFADHFLGVGFRGALRWDDRALGRLTGTLPRLASEFTPVGLLLALLGIVALYMAKRSRMLLMFFAAACAYTLFNALYQISDIADFYTPLYILAAFLMLSGAVALAQFALKRSLPSFAALALFALPALLLFGNIVAVQSGHDTTIRAHWQSILSPATANAILISNDRDEMTPLLYLQFVEGVRRDVAGLFPLISADPQYAHVVPLTEAALHTSRPVYLIKPMDGLSIRFRLQPEGPLVHVLGPQDTRPDFASVRDSSIARLTGWSRSGNTSRTDPLVISLYWQPLGESRGDFKTYLHFDGPDGKTMAQSDHTPGGDFYPPSQWLPGDTLRDAHSLALPTNLPPGAYQLVAGAYYPDGRSVDGIGRIDLGSLDLTP